MGYENYSQIPYGNLTLAYTKEYTDSGPITSTRVGPYACLDAREYDKGATDLLPKERDYKKKNCTKVDGAFVKLENFKTNELELQKLSGVYEKLVSLPSYNITDESKEANEYFFWIRPSS